MCGRYTLVPTIPVLEARFGASFEDEVDAYKANNNAAPSQRMPIITAQEPGVIRLARWGLVPAWAKDISIGNKMTNARAETLEERASFRNLIYTKRCLIPADGFYEWKPEQGGKQPYHITVDDGGAVEGAAKGAANGIMAFAGLYDIWKVDGAPLLTYTIITTAAHGPMSNIHDRMPLILSPTQEKQWLDAKLDKALVHDIIESTPRVSLSFAPVSKAINKVQKPGDATSKAAPNLFNYNDLGSE